jgi:hypothetical protein
MAHTAEQLGWANALHVDEKGEYELLSTVLGPKRLIVVGECVLRNGHGL